MAEKDSVGLAKCDVFTGLKIIMDSSPKQKYLFWVFVQWKLSFEWYQNCRHN